MKHETEPRLNKNPQEIKDDRKILWRVFYDASWELFEKGLKNLSWDKKQAWKKKFIKSLPVKISSYEKTKLQINNINNVVQYSLKNHEQEVKNKYDESSMQAITDAKIIVVTDNFFALVNSLGVTFQEGAGGIHNCFIALRNILPWNRYGRNEITIHNLGQEDIQIANYAIAGIAQQLHIQLDTLKGYEKFMHNQNNKSQ
jgi:hypothetical protein